MSPPPPPFPYLKNRLPLSNLVSLPTNFLSCKSVCGTLNMNSYVVQVKLNHQFHNTARKMYFHGCAVLHVSVYPHNNALLDPSLLYPSIKVTGGCVTRGSSVIGGSTWLRPINAADLQHRTLVCKFFFFSAAMPAHMQAHLLYFICYKRSFSTRNLYNGAYIKQNSP